MITTIQCLSPWCTSPMVTYGLDKDSLAPYTEIKVDPLVENNIDNEFNDKEVYDDDFDD